MYGAAWFSVLDSMQLCYYRRRPHLHRTPFHHHLQRTLFHRLHRSLFGHLLRSLAHNLRQNCSFLLQKLDLWLVIYSQVIGKFFHRFSHSRCTAKRDSGQQTSFHGLHSQYFRYPKLVVHPGEYRCQHLRTTNRHCPRHLIQRPVCSEAVLE